MEDERGVKRSAHGFLHILVRTFPTPVFAAGLGGLD